MRFVAVGMGRHAERSVLPAMVEASGIELVGVASRNPERAQVIGQRFGCSAAPSLHHLLEQVEAEAVYVASANRHHVQHIRDGLRMGLHVLCEKPIAPDFEVAGSLSSQADDAGLSLQEMAMFLAHPQHQMLRRIAHEGMIGDVRLVEAYFGFPHLDPSDVRYGPGGGALQDAGFYPVAAAVDLLGGGTSVEYAASRTDAGFEVDTGGIAVVARDGIEGFLGWGFGNSYRNEIRVWGSEGLAVAHRAFSKPAALETTIAVSRSDGSRDNVTTGPADHFRLALESFARFDMIDDRSFLDRSRVMTEIRKQGSEAVT